MAIDATVTGAKLNDDGTVKLIMTPSNQGHGNEFGLTVLNPPTNVRDFMSGMIGQLLWGGSSEIMVRDTKFADRETVSQIRLVDKPNPPVGIHGPEAI